METATEGASATALAAPSAAGEQRNGFTVAQLLLEYLKLEDATTIFGIPGGAAIYIIDELKKQDATFDFVVCRQETGAAYMAHGYAWAGGGLGVVLTTSGPAAANALTGTVNADAACCPLLTITGEVPEKAFGKGYLQEGIDAALDIDTIYRNAVSYSAVVSSESNAATLIEEALRVARSQPSRAAHLSIPNDVAGTCVTDPTNKTNQYTIWFPSAPSRYRTVPAGTDADAVELAFRDLAGATRPLLFLGNGARLALSDPDQMTRFTKLVGDWALPVATTPDAKGIFPETHELSLRNYGLCACTWPDVYMAPGSADQFDALMVLGSSLGELATTVVYGDQYSKNLLPTEHFIHVDLDEGMIGRNFPVTRGIVGDVGATIDVLCEAAAASERADLASTKAARLELIAGIKATSPFADPEGRASIGTPTHPAALMRVINETMTSGHIFIDAGNCVGWSLNNLVVGPQLKYHSALDMGPMGFGVCAVVGAKMAAPDETCLAIVGDGAFMMHAAEVSTAAAQGVEGVGAIWVVLYDNDLAMVSQGMGGLFPPSSNWTNYYALGGPDLVQVAQGFGADAVAITQQQGPGDFQQALETAIRNANENNKPQVIVVSIDTEPMPPYGWPQAPISVCSN
jgi:acetolactate synthase I/II/III large subunit